ncbi:hypothetical protein EHQ83_03230 [Leptospira yasudae]|uniref:Uncharacterized protein n=1 Tax=Leptospira yasudae TaxID=2202201 RepID=A0A6N4QRS1_9LEPT|nr:hypothetical protein EHQ72_15215 [Leptospira yasudae]TGL81604.1 hypothetical protein EHQ77_05865 [Leptospira yasudae]TGL88464.1 hypothetical protein EHQ83_03230 [Leptospira yasudae]
MKIWKENSKNGRTGGCILLENGRGLKNQGGLGKILEKERVFGICGYFNGNRNSGFHCSG